ncbi:MAG: M20/M25/M40 family metallo-hydrolase [Clostridia bacterium]|nr:M20/M25/M40 family metallo-hydrolase [Clostridia bacterium]
MKELIKTLCSLDRASGREDKVRDYIISQIGENEYTVDALGNLIVRVKGEEKGKNTVMLCSHMDEVGVMATFIKPDGTVKFNTVGGIQSTALLGKTVRFENGTVGAIGVKPVHLLEKDEREKAPETDKLYIDVGASSKEDAEKLVSPGDTAVFTSEFTEMGEKLLSKAIDDRAGNAVMLKMIKNGVRYDTVFCFNVQEEVGLRGAKTSTFAVSPDYAIVLEATTAADVTGAEDEKRVCVLGEGAAVSLMDRATVYSPELYKKVFEIAKENGIKAQPKTMVAGGNDAGSVHVSGKGVKTVTINVPCRYIHSPSCVCDIRDVEQVYKLATKVSEYFTNAD